MVGRPRAESELVAHAKRGDLDAFEQLVREHQGIAFRTAYVIAGSAADAEEAAQDAFVKAHRALGRFRAGAPFRPWLLAIVANEARNRRRSAGAARALRAARLVEERPSADAAPSPEAALLAREQRARLLAAIGRWARSSGRSSPAATCSGCPSARPRRRSAAARAPSSRGCRARSRGWRRSCERARDPPRRAARRVAARARRARGACGRGWRRSRVRAAGSARRGRSRSRSSCRSAAWPRSPRRAARCCAGSGSRACGSSACRRRPPRPPSASPLDLGERTRLPDGTLVPAPSAARRRSTTAGERVTLLYRPRRGLPESEHSGRRCAAVPVPRPHQAPFIRKFAGPDTTIEPVRIDGEPGFWLAGAPTDCSTRTRPVRSSSRPRGSPARPWSGGAAIARCASRPTSPSRGRLPSPAPSDEGAHHAAHARPGGRRRPRPRRRPGGARPRRSRRRRCAAPTAARAAAAGTARRSATAARRAPPPTAAPFYTLRITIDTGRGPRTDWSIDRRARAPRAARGRRHLAGDAARRRGGHHQARRGPAAVPGLRPGRRRTAAEVAPGVRLRTARCGPRAC